MTRRTPTPDADRIVAETRAWLRHAVVGLNLCPFAKAPFGKGQVRFAVCTARRPRALLQALCDEVRTLVDAPAEQVETTLLMHPNVLQDFAAFNDFLDVADAALDALGQTGVLQIASFHPHYRFGGTAPDALGNATNRAPYPTLQLLREASVERAVAAFPDAATIFGANVRTLEALGADGWAKLRAQCRRDADGDGKPQP